MRILYWNLRRFGNIDTQLIFSNHCRKFSSDFVFIEEPWVDFCSNPNNIWSNLDLKLVAVNDRGFQQSNLWCLCARHINVTVGSNSMQMISCETSLGDMSYYIAGVMLPLLISLAEICG